MLIQEAFLNFRRFEEAEDVFSAYEYKQALTYTFAYNIDLNVCYICLGSFNIVNTCVKHAFH